MNEPHDDHTLPPGYRLEEFEIVRVLGEGGFGIAYLAFDHSLRQQRVIKEFLPSMVARRGRSTYQVSARTGENNHDTFAVGLRSFISEARLLASLDHPNVVRVYRCLEANHTAYLVMHYYEGQTLTQRLQALGRMRPDADWVLQFLTQTLHGLQVVHTQGILHRDIKPDNIYLLDDDRPVLIDFGAARRVIGGRTKALTSVITEGYSPIEQYTGDSGLQEGPWTDLYALGATTYLLVTGHKPANAVMRVANDQLPPAVVAGQTNYPTTLLASIDRALIIRPTERCASAREWLAALEESTAPLKLAVPLPHGNEPLSSFRWGELPATAQPVTPAPDQDDRPAPSPLPETASATTLASLLLAPPTPALTARRRVWALGLGAMLLGGSVGGYVFWQHQRPADVTAVAVPASATSPSVANDEPDHCPMNPKSIDAALTQARTLAQQGDYGKALRCYRWAADRGNAEAQYHLGLLYEQGLGVTPNSQEAVEWYRRAADQGNADAQMHLGVLYETGEGLAQDHAQAAQWYRKAATQGHAWAQNNLGWLYENGQGVAVNQAEALKWYRQAAAQGETRAKNNLKRLGK